MVSKQEAVAVVVLADEMFKRDVSITLDQTLKAIEIATLDRRLDGLINVLEDLLIAIQRPRV